MIVQTPGDASTCSGIDLAFYPFDQSQQILVILSKD